MEMVEDDTTYAAINESRQTAMEHVWLWLIWILTVAIESLLYSSFLLILCDDSTGANFNIS